MELGTDGKFFGKTEDEYECARECRADEQCQGFLFCTEDNPAQFKDCFFKWNFGSPHIPYFTWKGNKAGYKSCRNDYNPIEGKLHKIQQKLLSISPLFHTILKVRTLSKNPILTKYFHEFFAQNFFGNFSREIKAVFS